MSKSDIVLNTAVPPKDIQYLQVVPCGNHIKVLISYYKTKPAQKSRNKGWKTDLNLGSRNNQQFKMIPFLLMYDMLSYKLEMAGINYIETEESYTSKCSFIDKEELKHHNSYAGRRIKRGLFKSKDGHKYNADINGSLNILRKYLTNQNAYSDKLHKELVAHMTNPKRITV